MSNFTELYKCADCRYCTETPEGRTACCWGGVVEVEADRPPCHRFKHDYPEGSYIGASGQVFAPFGNRHDG